VPDQNRGDPAADPGDLGRRVAYRRQELGLSTRDVAVRAGMAPGYIEYLERQPSELTTDELIRLANALDSTVNALLGSGQNTPPVNTARARIPS
jgi:transcriptional regulator with XRE-family HTH domain